MWIVKPSFWTSFFPAGHDKWIRTAAGFCLSFAGPGTLYICSDDGPPESPPLRLQAPGFYRRIAFFSSVCSYRPRSKNRISFFLGPRQAVSTCHLPYPDPPGWIPPSGLFPYRKHYRSPSDAFEILFPRLRPLPPLPDVVVLFQVSSLYLFTHFPTSCTSPRDPTFANTKSLWGSGVFCGS